MNPKNTVFINIAKMNSPVLFKLIKSILIVTCLAIMSGCGPSKEEIERQALEQQAAIKAAVAEALAKSAAEERQKKDEEQRVEKERIAAAESAKALAEKEKAKQLELLQRQVRTLVEAYNTGLNTRKIARAEEVAHVIRTAGDDNRSQQRDRIDAIELKEFDWKQEDIQAKTYYEVMKELYKTAPFVDAEAEDRLLMRMRAGEVLDSDRLKDEMKSVFPKAKL